MNHDNKVRMIETIWNLEFRCKQLRYKLEMRHITDNENNILLDIENKIKQVQVQLHSTLPNDPEYIFKTSLN